MSTKDHLYKEELSMTVKELAKGCQDFLLHTTYKPQGEYEICDDYAGFKQHTGSFFSNFGPQVKGGAEQRFTALRFLKPATIPLKEGATVDLVPVITSGNPQVSEEGAKFGWCLHLTKDTAVTPELYCLAVLTQYAFGTKNGSAEEDAA